MKEEIKQIKCRTHGQKMSPIMHHDSDMANSTATVKGCKWLRILEIVATNASMATPTTTIEEADSDHQDQRMSPTVADLVVMEQPNSYSKSKKRALEEDDAVGNVDRDYRFKILLPNGICVGLVMRSPKPRMLFEDFLRLVKDEYDLTLRKSKSMKPTRRIQWNSGRVYVEDANDNKIRNIMDFEKFKPYKCHMLRLYDGSGVIANTFENMWDLTPDTDLLMELPEEYTFETALADLIDNSLQAVWTNGKDERRLIRAGKLLTPLQLEKDYQDWLLQMHDLYDEEINCGEDQPVLVINPKNKKTLGITSDVVRVHQVLKRKGTTWKRGQKIKVLKGACAGVHKNNIYATLEYFLIEGFQGDAGGEARIICRPLGLPDENGCVLALNDGITSLDICSSLSLPISDIDSGKCVCMDNIDWDRQVEKQLDKIPSTIELLNTTQCQELGIDGMFDAYSNHVEEGLEVELNVDGFCSEDPFGLKRKVPECCTAGSLLEDVVFEIVDSKGDIDVTVHDDEKSGQSHTLTIKSASISMEDSIRYAFRHGRCSVPAIPLPLNEGLFCIIPVVEAPEVKPEIQASSSSKMVVPLEASPSLKNVDNLMMTFVDNEKRRLALPDPILPSSNVPLGFLGYAVNMVNLDGHHLRTMTLAGYGLRETLFYRLFGKLQIYGTCEYMIQARACIKYGAVSLDGGILRENGIISLGHGNPEICFPVVLSDAEMHMSPEITKKLKEIEKCKSELDKTECSIKGNSIAHEKSLKKFHKKKDKYTKLLNSIEPVRLEYQSDVKKNLEICPK
ncbi:hypothetical protein LWI28_026791 [Acer negundo]|uniref:Uncharacterized protein n=1 Tax=Acer negundo TaxID=4023 RepID=A0AAD5IEG8_ACENE|nr:hypothetical protein LWI28_026791 [Acer negundo]